MIIDTDKIIKLLLEDDHSIYSIAKAIDVTRSTLNVYRQKQDEDYIKEMSLDLAMKLQNFINEENAKMVYLITGFVKYNNENEDIRDFDFEDYPETLEEVLEAIENDISNVSGRSQGGVKNVEYVIYQAEKDKLDDEQYMEDLQGYGTDYYVTYNNKLDLDEVSVAGLEYQGEIVQEFEDYKVFVNSFDEFVDNIVYDLENEHGGLEVPSYVILKEHASVLLKNGRINEARQLLIDELLDFNHLI